MRMKNQVWRNLDTKLLYIIVTEAKDEQELPLVVFKLLMDETRAEVYAWPKTKFLAQHELRIS